MATVPRLRTLINASLDVLELELAAAQLPPLDLGPTPHPTDDVSYLPSPRLFEARRAATSALEMLATVIKPAWQVSSLETPLAACTGAAAHVAVWHGIPTHLGAPSVDPLVGLSAIELGEKTGLDADKLARLLRVLVTEGWFLETSPNVFCNTRIALAVVEGAPTHSLAVFDSDYATRGSAFVKDCLSDPIYGKLNDNSRTPLAMAYGTNKSYFEWLPTEPKLYDAFTTGMIGYSACAQPWQLEDFDYKALGKVTIVDVGGGQGTFAFPLLDKYENLSLILQDRPETTKMAEKHLANWPSIERSRVEIAPHDFFTPNPAKGDDKVFLVRWCTHNWDDDHCIKILASIAVAMTPKNTLLIYDNLVLPSYPPRQPDDIDAFVKGLKSMEGTYHALDLPYPIPGNGFKSPIDLTVDVCMYMMTMSKERSLLEFEKITKDAGLQIVKAYRGRGVSGTGILECKLA